VKAVDGRVGRRGRSRFIAVAVEERLRREERARAIREGTGVLDPSKHPEWGTPEKVSAWVRNLRPYN
jgi:hypothetical protein